ncbi:phage holin family protein [Rhodobacteraceae bacterium 2CG4]|uniref:Phage holin family protein n=1 Tax=Halovulum marinum TaxID=2662447 RepID=A0A6L5YY65_9RHOB|nr:phage holin family protein [Halovulum marinum]MSU88880.1 phage holin family protein [Halovulum marinum]
MPEDQAKTRGGSTAGLLGDMLQHVSSLVRNEVDLARAEVSESVGRASGAVVMLIVAAVLGLTALDVLAAAAVAALAQGGMSAGWAALIVGGVLAIVALLLAMRGRRNLKLSNLAPRRTAKNVRRDANTVKEIYNGD